MKKILFLLLLPFATKAQTTVGTAGQNIKDLRHYQFSNTLKLPTVAGIPTVPPTLVMGRPGLIVYDSVNRRTLIHDGTAFRAVTMGNLTIGMPQRGITDTTEVYLPIRIGIDTVWMPVFTEKP